MITSRTRPVPGGGPTGRLRRDITRQMRRTNAHQQRADRLAARAGRARDPRVAAMLDRLAAHRRVAAARSHQALLTLGVLRSRRPAS